VGSSDDEVSLSTSIWTVAVGVGHGLVGEAVFVGVDACGEGVPEVGVGEEAAAAAGVMDDGDLEWGRIVSEEGFGQGGDERDLADHLVGDAASGVAHDERVARVDAEDVCRVDASVHAGDDEDLVFGDRHQPDVGAGAGELLVALQEWADVRHVIGSFPGGVVLANIKYTSHLNFASTITGRR
jgi:hypothetical protein